MRANQEPKPTVKRRLWVRVGALLTGVFLLGGFIWLTVIKGPTLVAPTAQGNAQPAAGLEVPIGTNWVEVFFLIALGAVILLMINRSKQNPRP